MDQRSICLFLNKQGFSAFDIHRQLVDILKTGSIVGSIITRYLREAVWTAGKAGKTGKAERIEMDTQGIIAQAILAVLKELPFSSAQELAKRTYIPPTPVY
jgi:hypothetical protein